MLSGGREGLEGEGAADYVGRWWAKWWSRGGRCPGSRATATGFVEHGAEEMEHALGGEDGAEGELAGGGDGSQDREQDELVPEDVVDVVADLGLDAAGA